jgi:REP element-mobilizing transposase RayT
LYFIGFNHQQKDFAMTQPRKTLVCIEDTPYYHLISRCVRRSYLCGADPTTGKSYEHRRQWIEDRLRILSSLFAIDLCAYSVMSNHIHVVVKVCPVQSELWTTEEILHRWTSLYKGPLLVQKWLRGEPMIKVERKMVAEIAELYRQRLTSISWLMKCLNEPIARAANKEDQCTGHFWESRFKSQALLSEEALLSCMAYVDLNPVRARMAATPETSEHTSIKERLHPTFELESAVKLQVEQQSLQRFDLSTGLAVKPLAKFEGDLSQKRQESILFGLKDYLELVDFTGRILHPNKRGAISELLPPILKRLNLDTKKWLEQATRFESCYQKHFSKPRVNNQSKAA